MMSIREDRRGAQARASNETGGALVSSVLVLLLLTIFATAGFWLSRMEMQASHGYAQSTRALYSAEAGFARYFATTEFADTIPLTFELYLDPCLDPVLYPTPAAVTACQLAGDNEEEELLEDMETLTPSPASYAFLNTEVIVTADFVINDGITPVYELFSRATVTDPRNPELSITRMLAAYAQMEPPFEIKSAFAGLGGVEFGADPDDHYHFDGKAKAGKTGSCGTSVAIPGLTVPTGQFDLPLTDPDCPGGKGCPYKWHSKGMSAPDDVDTTSFATGTGIANDLGISWGDWQSDAFFSGMGGVVAMADSDSLETYFAKSKDKMFKASPEWPIVRFEGDLTTDQRVKGYGILIVEGDLIITADKLEWTGLLLVGGKIITEDGAHIHIKGAAIAGLGCSEVDIAAGNCRSSLDGDHNDMKYRPCEVAQAWRRMMVMSPRDGLWREITGN